MRVLFVPVSSARGLGEYARCREIAQAILGRWPAAGVHFLLSRQAPYAAECPFPATLLPASATLHTREVVETIETFRPAVVIFDNAGRTAQIQAARRAGALVIYASSRARQRRKAFRLRWMRMLDEHWIVYPRFIAGPLTPLERLKLSLLGRPAVRYMDTVLPPRIGADEAVLARLRLAPGEYVLIVPGGGSSHPGAAQAPRIVAEAAASLAAGGIRTVLVGLAPPLESSPLLLAVALMPLAELLCLMRAARLIITNGGDTLLQALSCGRPCVAVPIAHDQAGRIERLRALGLIADAPLQAAALAQRVLGLLADRGARAKLEASIVQHPIVDAMPGILRIIGARADRAELKA